MENKKPIFLGGFARGGSNIFLNFFLSHPDVCCPAHEFQEVFLGRPDIDSPLRRKFKKFFVALPLVSLARQNFLSMNNCEPRKKFSPTCQFLVDRAILAGKFSERARHENLNLYKSEGIEYKPEEIAQSRTVTKILNGQILLTENLSEMYPDAVFFGLVRDGLATCLGYVRRGLLSASDFGELYKKTGEAMLAYSQRMQSFHLYRFDDILADPVRAIQSVYHRAGLDIAKVPKVRLQAKATINNSGQVIQHGAFDRQLIWYSYEDVVAHFQSNIDSIQKNQLTNRDRDVFLSIAGRTMEKLGFSTD